MARARYLQIPNFAETRGQSALVGAVAVVFAFVRAFIAARLQMCCELCFKEFFNERFKIYAQTRFGFRPEELLKLRGIIFFNFYPWGELGLYPGYGLGRLEHRG